MATPAGAHTSESRDSTKLRIPPEYGGYFTDNQAEELIAQFQLCDGDGSGAIDEREFRTLLGRLSLEVSEAEASALVAGVDTDGNGLIDFTELVAMVVRIKQGDVGFQGLRAFVDALETTPVALLEREAGKFGLRITYQLLEERAATATTPGVVLMELRLEGKWCGPSGVERLEAIGRTTREAKFRAAEAGLARLRRLQPGLAVGVGELPDDWRAWLFDNLERGGKPAKLMRKLGEKGFSPARNRRVMEQISARVSSLRFRNKRHRTPPPIYENADTGDGNGDGDREGEGGDHHDQVQGDSGHDTPEPHLESAGQRKRKPPRKPGAATQQTLNQQQRGQRPRRKALHPLWVHWAQQELARGISGPVVIDELVAQGFEPRCFPALTQSLLAAGHDHLRGPDDQGHGHGHRARPAVYSFSRCLLENNLREVELFLLGGRDVDEAETDPATQVTLTALQVAAKRGFREIVALLLERGADVARRDGSHRTPLHLAAREGHSAICELLVGRDPSLIVAVDATGNTPLHLAAASGSVRILELLLGTHDQALLHALADLPRRRGIGYPQLLRDAHTAIMAARLRANERRRFHLSWVWDALQWTHEQLFRRQDSGSSDGGGRASESDGVATPVPTWIPRPRLALLDHLIARFHPRFVKETRSALAARGEGENENNENGGDGGSDEGDDDDGDEEDEADLEAGLDAGVRERRRAARVVRREWIPVEEVTFLVDLCLRETYKHLPNHLGRAALHVACHENLVCTHELAIQCLADAHGSDPGLLDHTQRDALALVVLQSQGRPGSPTSTPATHEHERRLLRARHERVAERDRQRAEALVASRRRRWDDEVRRLGDEGFQALETLAACAKAALQAVKATNAPTMPTPASLSPWSPSTPVPPVEAAGGGWIAYLEPETRNRVFVNSRSGFCQRQVPGAVAEWTAVRLGWKEKLMTAARFVEQHPQAPEWELHRVHHADVYFFFNRVTTVCQWLPPDEPETPVRAWRSQRFFHDQEELDDCDDHAALRVAFSGTWSRGLLEGPDCLKGRRLDGSGGGGSGAAAAAGASQWRESRVFGVTLYHHDETQRVAIEKPIEVLAAEAARFAHARIRRRSEELEDLAHGWRRWYDPETALSFYFDDTTGDCVPDHAADRVFRRGIRRPRRRRLRDDELTAEELRRRREEREWKAALVRARRRDQRQQQQAQDQAAQVAAVGTEEAERRAALEQLERRITSEHLDPARGLGLGYIEARYRREAEVWETAQRHETLTSLNPATRRPTHELERGAALEQELDDQEREHSKLEDIGVVTNDAEAEAIAAAGASRGQGQVERRRVSRVLWRTLERLRLDRVLCRWGCGRWFPRGPSLQGHEFGECPRRRMLCRLGCGQIREDHVWQREIREHEDPFAPSEEDTDARDDDHHHHHQGQQSQEQQQQPTRRCPRRIVPCPRDCGVFVARDELPTHLTATCVRRPLGPLPCRLGCGWVDPEAGAAEAHELLRLEQQRAAHEEDACPLRRVTCTWPRCQERLVAREAVAHRRRHLRDAGIVSFVTPEAHEYRVPRDASCLKLQCWGGGGGSGHLRGQRLGRGGGGAFVEGIVRVHPGETLHVVIGGGGHGGRHATLAPVQEDDTEAMAAHHPRSSTVITTGVSRAKGGTPGGGGAGHSGNKETACGGGGGCTVVYRHGAYGIEYLVIAGGGGGGGTCRDGQGGRGWTPPKTPTTIAASSSPPPPPPPLPPGADPRMGRGGTATAGGDPGECDPYNPVCRFTGTAGASMQGGDGGEFGGGGGGGLFGGGGGGFAPGIVGGGGGGASYVHAEAFEPGSVVVLPGGGGDPGGRDRDPPRSVRRAYWDLVEGVVGEGGVGSIHETARGNHGGVRIARPGFFKDMHEHR